MRNLKTVQREHVRLSNNLPLSVTAWDTRDNSVICAFGPTIERPLIELKRRKSGSSEFIDITSWDAPSPLDDLECDEILLLQYFSDIQTSCLVLAGGDIVVVREDPSPDQEKIEIVGSVDAGICAAAWAPDEELLAIVTRADTLVLMSRTFEPVTETTLAADDLKASKHVSVGWGKKETQFQGKRAKALRDPTIPETVDEGKPSELEDGKVSISWRGDGRYFAVNGLIKDHRRVIRVYDREAVLDSASEPVDGLESALSWRPYGNLIAGIKRSTDKVDVVFFERNGLRHGEFALRVTKEDLNTWARQINLRWNVDSTVLAVVFLDRIQLWTMGNYHYYLKQELTLPPTNTISRLPQLRWHQDMPLKLTVSTDNDFLCLTYLFAVSGGSTISPNDYGVVAVIDGSILKLTPLRQAGVPPPMAFCEVNFDHNIVHCAVSPSGERLAILTTDTLEMCSWQMYGKSDDDTQALSRNRVRRYGSEVTKSRQSLGLAVTDGLSARSFTQVIFQGNDEVFLLAPADCSEEAHLCRVEWKRESETASPNKVPVLPGAGGLFSDVRQQSLWVGSSSQLNLISNTETNNSLEVSLDIGPAQYDIKIFQVNSASDALTNGYHDPSFHKVSLDRNGLLYVDDRVIAKDCTSFEITDAHLLFTTSQHLLKFVHLADPVKMEVPGDTPEVDERCRSIERGAKIITVIPSIYAVVLQMPRGNLETIYPRLLVLTGIRHHVQVMEYRSAFLACQSHQVDLNILHDLQPDIFISTAAKCMEQLKKPSRIDEFLSKLKDEDVTKTLYRDTLADQNQPQTNGTSTAITSNTDQPGDKVNRICDAFLSVLSPKSIAQLRNIITAHVCKRPPDLKSALTLVSSLRTTSEEDADLAVSHLCFLTDTNRLFDAALSLYDLELTLLVAQNSQRDPREYIPFLQSLQDLPLLRRQYEIDNHLRNYSKALSSLHELQSHDEVEKYSVKHNLYTHALSLYRYDATRLTNMTKLYADNLASRSQHASAATLYESIGDYTSAYPLYALAHQWRESLSSACLVPLDTSSLTDLAQSLATTLSDENRDYRSAATIHIEYLHDIPTAARLLCKGSYFAEAIRLLTLPQPPPLSALPPLPSSPPSQSSPTPPTTLLQQIIDPALSTQLSSILELLSDCKTQLTSQIPRITELRQKKADDPLAFFGGDPSSFTANAAEASGVDMIPDNISLAGTDASTIGGQSLFTRYGSDRTKFGGTVASNVSRKTSKTKRREERKRARGKKGSVYEEEYLVSSVARLVERVNGVHDEVGRLVAGLGRRGLREQAGLVEERMREMEGECQKAREVVWGVEAAGGSGGGGVGVGEDGAGGNVYDVNGEGRPRGADGVLWDSQMDMMNTKKEAPVVKKWVGNGLFSSVS